MKSLFTLLISLTSCSVFAQVAEPAMLSLQVYEGNCSISSNVSPQLDGGFILDMFATSTDLGDVDSLCTMRVDRTIFLKYNSDASILEWSKCYAGNFTDSSFIYMFSTLSDDYILGGIGKGESHNFLLHKENAAGTILWSKSYGDSAEAILESMIATNDGGYIMAGESYYTNVDFPIHYGSWMDEDIAVIKVDSNGDKVWSKVIGGTLSDVPYSVVSGPSGGCYIMGRTSSNDNDCIGNHGNSDAYLVRLDNNGNLLWHKDLGGTSFDGGTCGWPDGNGGVIIGGTTNSHDGDVTHYVGGIWVVNVDSNGNIVWNNSYGNGGNESPNAICKATDGSIWIAGASGTKGGEIDTAYGNTDAWFVHTDNTGTFLNAKVLGSHVQDEGYMVYPLSNGNTIAGGYYDTTGGSFPFISWGGGGTFLTIFAPWTESVKQINVQNDIVKIYPNPANEIVNIETLQKDSYMISFTDMLGRTIFKTTLKDKIEINVNGWVAGMYYVQIVSESGYCSVQKLIIH